MVAEPIELDAVIRFDPIREDSRVAHLIERIRAGEGPVSAEGLWGSAAPVLAALVADQLQRPLLYVTAHSEEADDCRDDIETALGNAPDFLPPLESLPGESDASDELVGERLRLCLDLLEASNSAKADPNPARIVAPMLALLQPVPSRTAIEQATRHLQVGQQIEPTALVEWLETSGFRRGDAVEHPGDYAFRGGIIDVYSEALTHPVRLEFFDDQLESVRLIETGTQRSIERLHGVGLPSRTIAAGTTDDPTATTSFLALLPPETLVAIQEPEETQEIARALLRRLGERTGLFTPDAILARTLDFRALHLRRFVQDGPDHIELAVQSLPQFEHRAGDAIASLAELSTAARICVACENPPEKERCDELLRENEVDPARVTSVVGLLHQGFQWTDQAYLPSHELFRRQRPRRTLRRVAPARPIDSFFDLQVNDFVVHIQHGIGRFRGLKTLDAKERNAGASGGSNEYLLLEFADQAFVHVPVSQIHLVQKYIGGKKGSATLSKLGGQSWSRTKRRVEESVADLAAELLAIQADRASLPGIAWPQDTHWQQEFEGSFLYNETEDQLRALAEIKKDMQRPRPMDRLLCGDVGFGKTELAIRAAFKVVEYGKQAAVLVPTTVLAEQHEQTFRDRLSEYPFSIEALSRFRSKKEQTQIIERARKGQVDILIGTHRLLSPDVRFADLGLVVIDEEQRFGVEAKERLKKLRTTVDVLTLSATPIPRTLHMSLLGIRDISSLATPPMDRRAIVTQVRSWDDRLIRDAIVREMNRDGQVFFIHNFVRDIEQIANHVRALVPEARVVVGHGQMHGHELEDVMLRFLRKEADVLVATTIVESGIDIASANTIFINRADRFGLAELHQLRGRVGRSNHRAYCYLLLSKKQSVNEQAAKRLKAIERYSDLGAGFQIAMRDLEIRGAGNILGAEQSGNIEAVGYELYCELLDQATRRLRNEPAAHHRPINLDLGITAVIPRGYIRSDRQRMEVYRRLTLCRTAPDVATLRDDVRDAYGPLPDALETLLKMAEIRVLAREWGVRSLVLDEPDVIFAIEDLNRVQPLFSSGPGSPRVPDAKTVHWRLPKRLLEPNVLLDQIRALFQNAEQSPTVEATAPPAATTT